MTHLWNKVQDDMVDEKNISKRSMNIFLVPSQRYPDSSHLLQNPTFTKSNIYKILKFLGASWALVIAHKDLLDLIICM